MNTVDSNAALLDSILTPEQVADSQPTTSSLGLFSSTCPAGSVWLPSQSREHSFLVVS